METRNENNETVQKHTYRPLPTWPLLSKYSIAMQVPSSKSDCFHRKRMTLVTLNGLKSWFQNILYSYGCLMYRRCFLGAEVLVWSQEVWGVSRTTWFQYFMPWKCTKECETLRCPKKATSISSSQWYKAWCWTRFCIFILTKSFTLRLGS